VAVESPPYVLQSASHGAALFRQTAQSMLAGTGVVSPTDLAVAQNGTPNMSVNVAAGQVWLPGPYGLTAGLPSNLSAQTGYGQPSGLTAQGSYFGYNDASLNLAIAAADPTNPRIDVVCATIEDSFYSGASNLWVIQVITGTPAPTPAVPTVPQGSVVCAQVAVAANAPSIETANITDERPFMAVSLPRNLYKARAYRNGSFTIPSAQTSFVYDTKVYDPNNNYSTSTGLYTCPVAGLYTVKACISMNATASGQQLLVNIMRNGSIDSRGTAQASSTFPTVAEPTADIECAAGDTLGVSYSGTSSVGGRNLAIETFFCVAFRSAG
jgi:hypothetical protein